MPANRTLDDFFNSSKNGTWEDMKLVPICSNFIYIFFSKSPHLKLPYLKYVFCNILVSQDNEERSFPMGIKVKLIRLNCSVALSFQQILEIRTMFMFFPPYKSHYNLYYP